jgi:eukaryotic-like serine/threonine-protein kinase
MNADVSKYMRIKVGMWTVTPALNLLENRERSIRIEPRTMDVLVYLARRAGEVVSIEELLEAVWQGIVVGDSSVYVSIKQLRRALAIPGEDAGYIETIPKRGYRLTVPVEEIERANASVPKVSPPVPQLDVRWSPAERLVLAAVLFVILAAQWAMRDVDAGASARSARANAGGGGPFTTVRFEIPTKGTWGAAVSPDGKYIAYAAGRTPETSLLFVRPIDSVDPRPLSGTEGAARPFWSPDGQQIGFQSQGLIKRIALAGGGARGLASTPVAGGGAWNADGVILFDGASGIERVHATGGSQSKVTELRDGELAHVAPAFLPDGRRFLFTSAFGKPGVYMGSLDSAERTRILPESAIVAYSSGHLLFNRGSTLVAQQFDAERLTLEGEPVQIAEGLGVDQSGVFGFFSVSETGVIVYETEWRKHDGPVQRTQLVWYDRNGQRVRVVGEPGDYRGFALAPDGRHIAVHAHEQPKGGNLWILDQERDTFMRLTSGPAHDMFPVWSPDGSRVLFTGANFNLYLRRRANAAGPEELLLDALRFTFPSDWSSDGNTVLVTHAPGNGHRFDVSALVLDGRRPPVSLLDSPFNESAAKFSPDNRWIAYVSDESGRSEVYVRAFPDPTGVWQVSTAGGEAPRWSGDGRELFYLAPGGMVMAVPIDTDGSRFSLGIAKALFRADVLTGNHDSAVGELGYEPYAVSSDGQRFLVNEHVDRPDNDPERPSNDPTNGSVAVIVNWTAGLER